MIGLYYFFFSLALVLAGPFLLLKKRARAGIVEKFGKFSPELVDHAAKLPAATPRVWFHAVSVGEFNAVFPLVEKFHQEHPEYQVFISTTTFTGQELAKAKASSFAQVFYFPMDLPWITKPMLDLLRPNLVAIVETEIWPGFMAECKNKNIPVVLLNGRLSPRSFDGYMRWKFFFGPIIARFNALAVQSESEKERYLALANNNEVRINVCGNIKLDGIKPSPANDIAQLRDKLNLKADELVVVAGSTHETEESALLEALKQLNGRFRLVLVPRHPERFERVQQIIENYGFRARRFSRQENFDAKNDVYLLDTIGQLNKFYGLAEIAFVGGTLANIGGHNLVEPCAYKAAVICGPNIHKTKDLFKKLSEREALLMVHNEKDLISTLTLLLDSPVKRRELGENGNRFLAENQGALAKTLALLEEYLDTRDIGQETKVETLGGVGR